MSTDEIQKHTLANCAACYHTAAEQQANFPQKPIYTPPDPMESAIKSSIDRLKAEFEMQPKPSQATIGKAILKELNPVYICEAIAGTSVQKILENTPGAGVQKRKTVAEKKKIAVH